MRYKIRKPKNTKCIFCSSTLGPMDIYSFNSFFDKKGNYFKNPSYIHQKCYNKEIARRIRKNTTSKQVKYL